jgi:hypothetical protein
MISLVRQMMAPLELDVSGQYPRRVNLLMATINFKYVFGGYMAMFHFALRLVRSGHRVRIVIVEPCDYDIPAWRREIAKYPGIESLLDTVEFADRLDRAAPLEVHPRDAFIATSCWTGHIAHKAVSTLGHDGFLFFAQEYEPLFFPMGSFYSLAGQAYDFPQFTLFSTDFLRDYFADNRLGVFRGEVSYGQRHSAFFRNAINSFSLSERNLASRDQRRLLFYARPEQHAARNMFELGMLGLSEAIGRGFFDLSRWEFRGIGSLARARRVRLQQGVEMEILPKVSLQEYRETLPSFDLGLSLMLSPHPSLMPLDMASAGMVAITNTFANKTQERLEGLSRNIIAVPPTVEGISSGLGLAVARVEDFHRRVEASHLDWPTDWDEAFDEPLISRINGFLESTP